MYRVWKQQRKVSKKLLCFQLDSHSSSMKFANLGEVFCFTDHPVLESRSWPKHVLPNVKEHSSQLVHLIWSASGWVSPKSSLSNCSTWREKRNLRLFSLTKSIHSVDLVPKVKTIPQEESRLNSLYRCKVSETAWMES